MSRPDQLVFKSISEFHRACNLPKPEHPLISVVDFSKVSPFQGHESASVLMGWYCISIKKNMQFKMMYGQQEYDFDEGVMLFIAPNQVLRMVKIREVAEGPLGWIMFIHPDFLWNTPLAAKIKQYEFFNYAINEALFLSDKEEKLIEQLVNNIQDEYRSNIDNFSQGIIISQIETLLNYADRFYQRQFITRKITSHKLLDRLEIALSDYFENGDAIQKGLPTVQYMANTLNISQSYLGGLLRSLTGKSTQHYIQDKIIEKAKEKLSTTTMSVSEIAYELGFEHSQSFNKLFKVKTNLSPLQFRHSFN